MEVALGRGRDDRRARLFRLTRRIAARPPIFEQPFQVLLFVAPIAQELELMVLEADQRERVPGLDALEELARIGVRVQIRVESRRVGVEERAHARIGSLVLFAREARDLESARDVVVGEGFLSQELRSTPGRPQEVPLDRGPVFLGLHPRRPEQDAGVRRAEDVRHAIAVAVDRRPARVTILRPGGRRCQERDEHEDRAP